MHTLLVGVLALLATTSWYPLAIAQLCSYTVGPALPAIYCPVGFSLVVTNATALCATWVNYFNYNPQSNVPSTQVSSLWVGVTCNYGKACTQLYGNCYIGFAFNTDQFYVAMSSVGMAYIMTQADSLTQCYSSSTSSGMLTVTIQSNSSNDCNNLADMPGVTTSTTTSTSSSTRTSTSTTVTSTTSTSKSTTTTTTTGSTSTTTTTTPVTTTRLTGTTTSTTKATTLNVGQANTTTQSSTSTKTSTLYSNTTSSSSSTPSTTTSSTTTKFSSSTAVTYAQNTTQVNVTNTLTALNETTNQLSNITGLNSSRVLALSQTAAQQVSQVLGALTSSSQREAVIAALQTIVNALAYSLPVSTNSSTSVVVSATNVALGAAYVPLAVYSQSSLTVSFAVQSSANSGLAPAITVGDGSSPDVSAIYIPTSVISRIAAGNAARAGFMALRNSQLFQSQSLSQVVGSLVISASLLDLPAVTNSEQPIQISLPNSGSPNLQGQWTPECSYWNVSSSQWSTDGCWLNSNSTTLSGNQQFQCECNHLTDFAMIFNAFNFNASANATNSDILSIASYVGCTVSALCLTVTIALATSVRGVRTHISGQLLISQSVALEGLNLLYIFNAVLSPLVSPAGCTVLAALLHYFLLASFCWTVMQSAYLYMKLVVVFTEYMPRFMLKVSFVAWCVPIVPLIVLLALQNVYGSYQQQMCWITKDLAFYVSTVAPIGLILLLNFITYIFALHKVVVFTRRQAKRKWLRQSNSPQNTSSVEGQTVKCASDILPKEPLGLKVDAEIKESVYRRKTANEESRRGSEESGEARLDLTYENITANGLNLVQRQESNATSNVNLVIRSAEAEQRAVVLTQLKFGAGLFFLLGLTWILAFFTFGVTGWIFALAFAIANGLQGVFILLFCCAKGEVKKWIRKHFLLHYDSARPSAHTSEIVRAEELAAKKQVMSAAASDSPTVSNPGSQTLSSVVSNGSCLVWPDPRIRQPVIETKTKSKPFRNAHRLHSLFGSSFESGNVTMLAHVKKESSQSESTFSTSVSRNTSLSSQS